MQICAYCANPSAARGIAPSSIKLKILRIFDEISSTRFSASAWENYSTAAGAGADNVAGTATNVTAAGAGIFGLFRLFGLISRSYVDLFLFGIGNL
jgi:hypothetical protein